LVRPGFEPRFFGEKIPRHRFPTTTRSAAKFATKCRWWPPAAGAMGLPGRDFWHFFLVPAGELCHKLVA
jgi:hypothetical protein